MVDSSYFPPDMRQRVAEVLAAQKAFDSPEFKRRLDEIYSQQKHLDLPEIKRQIAHAVAVSKALDPPATAELEERIAEDLEEPEDRSAPTAPGVDPFGFREMTVQELADWMGGGHAEVGSPRWEQARAWQGIKLMEARESSTPSPGVEPSPRPPWWQRGPWQVAIGVATILAAIGTIAAIIIGSN
jgi:hypothetical protein